MNTTDTVKMACSHCGHENTLAGHFLRTQLGSADTESVAPPAIPCIDWLGVLATDLERRAALAGKNASCPDSAIVLLEVARAVRLTAERCAQSERAPSDQAEVRRDSTAAHDSEPKLKG